MKCKIQWIDSGGKPTVDTNDAIAYAVSTIRYKDGEIVRRSYPCCTVHMERLVGLMKRGVMVEEFYTSEWTIEGLNVEALED